MRFLLVATFAFLLGSWRTSSLASESLSNLFDRLEYDQEIRGLFVPQGWFNGMGGDLLIGSVKVIPDSGNLYCLGWRPALYLDSIFYTGSFSDFFDLASRLAKQSRANVHLTRVKTKDRREEFDCTISSEGVLRIHL